MKIPAIWFFLGSGLLFGLTFVFSFLFFLFIPAFVLLFLGIERVASTPRLFVYGVLTGSLQYAGSFFWVWSAFPILWLTDAPVWIQFCAIGAYWVLTSLCMGIACGVFTVASKKCLEHTSAALFLLPILWVLSEVLKSFIFSVYSFGPGGFLSSSFSYGYIGYLLSEVPLFLQLSVLAGVYGLSLIAVGIGFGVYTIYRRGKRNLAAFVTCVCMLLAFFPVPSLNTEEPAGKEVIAVEVWFSGQYLTNDETLKKEKREEIKKALEAALLHEPDYIVLPEDVRFADTFSTPEDFWEWFEGSSLSSEVVLIDNGSAKDARGVDVIRSYMYDLNTHSAYFFDKRYLVPQGEYISYLHRAILSLFLSDESLERVVRFSRFEPGVMIDGSEYPKHLPGILFCFETMVPYGVMRAASFRAPDFVAHPISHAWFTNPFSLESQLSQMLKVSAIWSGVPVVSAGSLTESLLFSPTGERTEGELLEEGEHWVLKRFSI